MTLDRPLICLAVALAMVAVPAQAKHAKRGKPHKAVAVKGIKAKAIKQAPEPRPEPMPADSQALLQDTLPATPKHVMGCEGVFARDTTHARLVAEFGAKNVTFKAVDGSSEMATVLFDDDPTRRAVVYWRDAAGRANPARIEIGAPSTWVGPGGVHNGLPLQAVEELNGGGFKVMGFEGKTAGLVTALKGPLAAPPGGCTLNVRFEPGIANPLPPKFAAITGEREISSSNALMKRARPQVSEWAIVYR